MSLKPIRQQFAETMLDVGQKDQDLVVMVGDISHFRLQPFAKACPGRFYNIGICEPTMISMGAGLAKSGLYPVLHTIAPFIIDRSYEQIKLDFCYQKLWGNIITVGSAFDYANLGCTHHCYNDAGLLKSLEGIQLVYPGSSVEFDTLFKQTYRNHHLTVFRLPESSHNVEFSEGTIKFGKGVMVRAGSDVTIVVTGPHLHSSLAAADTLAAQGKSVEIIYIHTLLPLDVELIRASVAKTRRVLVVEEHVRSGGLGSDVLFHTHDINDVRYSFLCIPDQFIRGYGHYEEHCRRLGFSQEGIVSHVQKDLV